MNGIELRPEVAALTVKIQALLQRQPETDPVKLRCLTENIVDSFDVMNADDKSQCFTFLLGLVWGLHENLRQATGNQLSAVSNTQPPTFQVN